MSKPGAMLNSSCATTGSIKNFTQPRNEKKFSAADRHHSRPDHAAGAQRRRRNDNSSTATLFPGGGKERRPALAAALHRLARADSADDRTAGRVFGQRRQVRPSS